MPACRNVQTSQCFVKLLPDPLKLYLFILSALLIKHICWKIWRSVGCSPLAEPRGHRGRCPNVPHIFCISESLWRWAAFERHEIGIIRPCVLPLLQKLFGLHSFLVKKKSTRWYRTSQTHYLHNLLSFQGQIPIQKAIPQLKPVGRQAAKPCPPKVVMVNPGPSSSKQRCLVNGC